MNMIGDILMQLWGVLAQMAPYLLLGFAMAGVLSVLMPAAVVERHLGGRGFWPILKAALLAVPLPLCSCGVIPVAASLRRHGASRASTIAFLIATPETGVDSIMGTYSLLGGVFTFFRVVVAFVSGIVGGVWIALLGGPEPAAANGAWRGRPARASRGHPALENATDRQNVPYGQPDAGGTPARREGETPSPRETLRDKLLRMARHGFVDLPQDIGRSLLIGLVIAAAIGLVPHRFFIENLGFLWNNELGQMLLMAILGIPTYVCATASVPVAMSLMSQGLSPGAAAVFLIIGPATNVATITMIWRLMGRRSAVIYLASITLVAVAAGLTMNGFFRHIVPMVHMHHIHEHIAVWHHVAGAALLSLLIVSLIRRYRPGRPATVTVATPAATTEHHTARPQDMLISDDAAENTDSPSSTSAPADASLTLHVTGMTCSHCAAAVQRALLETPGVRTATVDLRTGLATVQGQHLIRTTLIKAVKQAGYSAE